ncbi:MAG: UDP-3-O-(3-hydroxymyristoyl)glucosamine N-acyltransferase [Phycisphaerales bacterium]
MTQTLAQLAGLIGAELKGDGSIEVDGCAPIDTASPRDVSFIANARYTRFLESTEAAAVIVGRDLATRNGRALLVADDPYYAFRAAMIALHGFRSHPMPIEATEHAPNISQQAAIHPTASVGEGTTVHPFSVLESGARVGANTVIYPNVYVGPDVTIGDECILYPGVAVYDRCILGNRVTLHANTAIGHDGFGYATHEGVHHKIPQHGIVVIEDDVELGAGCAIERAAMGETRIGRGTKFADLISIGHGTTVGEHCLFVSLVGVSGSVKVGNHVVLGGQVGVSGHLAIGDRVMVAGKTGIGSDVPEGQRIGGFIPSVEFRKAKRNAVIFSDLPALLERIRTLERRLDTMNENETGQ